MTGAKADISAKLNGMESFLLLLLGVGLCLDVPSARAYNEHEAWTERLGQYLFHGFKDLWNLPLPFTLFELLSYGSLLVILLIWGMQRGRLWLVLTASALIVPATAALAWISGVLRGHAMGLAFTQIHAIPMLAVWLGLGYFMGLRASNNLRVFRIIFYASLFKALYALYVYAFIFGMDMGDREYLIDHPSSIYLFCGMIYAFWQLLKREVSIPRKSLFLLALLAIGSAYGLNDRRASYAGVMIAALLLPWILPRNFRRDIWPLYRMGLVAALIGLVAFAIEAHDPYSFFGGLKSEILSSDVLSYRHIENFNLLSGVMQEPIFGMGFGTQYPQVIALPDISATFALFTAIPHNSLYFLWAFAGPLGIASFISLAWFSLILITRCGAWAKNSTQLFYAILALFLAAQWILFVYFDMGLLEVRSLMVFGLVIGSLYPQYALHIKDYYSEKLS